LSRDQLRSFGAFWNSDTGGGRSAFSDDPRGSGDRSGAIARSYPALFLALLRRSTIASRARAPKPRVVLAMANMPLAQQRFPEAFPEEDEPQRCEAIEITTGFRCVSEVGHTGRHRYRDVMGDFMADATRDPTPIN